MNKIEYIKFILAMLKSMSDTKVKEIYEHVYKVFSE